MPDFQFIDFVIEDFLKDKPHLHLDKEAETDWCQFEYRGIRWKANGLDYLVEIFPELEADCSYKLWNLTTIVTKDENNHRYYRTEQINKLSFDELKTDLTSNLKMLYDKLSSLKREDLTEFIEIR